MSITKGNIVTSNDHGTEGLVLAVTKDGKRAKIYVLGSDGKEVWRPVDKFTVTVDGDEVCWKCGGSGIFYGGGATVNGVYKGYSGECYGCQGKGTQNNADRVRNHHYWHREHSVWEALDAIEKGETPEPLYRGSYTPEAVSNDEPVKPAKVKIRSKKKPATQAKPASHTGHAIPAVIGDPHPMLIDCKGCGTVHRDDVLCPW